MRWLSNETIQHLQKLAEWPDLIDTKYLVRGELGRGGMGTVYLAEDTVLGREVALKVAAAGNSDAETGRRLLHEARVVARLEHPSIVPIHDVGTLPDGRVYYAMKRVDGHRLDELAKGSLLSERLRIFQRICEAIAFAHARGVIHRDLKPENIMVGPFGEVLVMDWGVAKIVGDDETRVVGVAAPLGFDPPATADGAIVGTLQYMAPEQAQGRLKDIGPTTDVYALGALLYFLLTNRAPFEREAAARRAREGTEELPVPMRHLAPDLPRPLEAIVAKAMSPVPAERYASAEELSADVARFASRERVLAYQESPFERAGRLVAQYRTPILLVLAYLFMRAALILFGGP